MRIILIIELKDINNRKEIKYKTIHYSWNKNHSYYKNKEIHLDYLYPMVKIHLYQKEIQKICTHQHLNIEEIFTELKKKFPKVGISTIYRNVDEMTKNKILKQLKLPWNKTIYESDIGIHAHLINQENGKIQDIEIPSVIYKSLPKEFDISHIDVMIYGKPKKN